MKKLIALTLSVTMILSLSACGKKEQIPSNNASNNSDNTGKTYSIDIGHGGAESTAQQVGCLALKDYLENNSNGLLPSMFIRATRSAATMSSVRWCRTATSLCALRTPSF